ncbi:unnamed protein product [Chilo suppressalis]|uniref:UDP-glucuronosyltransferase n=1 Tax=Chilo suppressalis TaxID=168631 RepID=A0ABN8B6M2_CHISP|nr:unnamed protein product [Chilo suppressalis]
MSNIPQTSVLLLLLSVCRNDAARILAVYPTPSISHQVVFRPLTLELLKRGHELVVITTDPIFPNGKAPANLTEIDFHDKSYTLWREHFLKSIVNQGTKEDSMEKGLLMYYTMLEIFKEQITSKEVQTILKDKSNKFDLLLLEAYFIPALALTHFIKAPVIQISSLGSTVENLAIVGASTHPLLFPTMVHQKIYNQTMWDKLRELIVYCYYTFFVGEVSAKTERFLKETFGPDLPDTSQLRNNVDLVFLNVHPIWEMNRPMPPNVIYTGGLHQNPQKELPQDLKEYLDLSENGVIYISFGTNVNTSLLIPEKVQIMIDVLSTLSYDVLWKWNTDELPGRSKNIKISKWLPQSDLLRHPKIKLFITQGGLQSTDETITAGVPIIGMPILGDQWYNVEQCVHHKVGVYVDMGTMTEEIFKQALDEVLNNDSYRRNMQRLRALMRDQPQTPLERAVWWTEYVLRNGGARHLRSPSANITWSQYFELELVFYISIVIITLLVLLGYISLKVLKLIKNSLFAKAKVKFS